MELEQRLEEALRALGADQIEHSGGTFFQHLIGTHNLLKTWGNPQEVCLAGLFHSIYGTEYFTHQSVPLGDREKIRALIGERSERLAYYFCAADRKALIQKENTQHILKDRFEGREYEITKEDHRDFCEMDLANFVEQVPDTSFLGDRLPFYIELYSVCIGLCSEGAVAAYRDFFGSRVSEVL